jgi:uncharacterized protein YbaR (Trm112 family)
LHVLLTDVLTCPHCGPDWSLILLAEQVNEGRVLAGTLGCPNCRAHFPVKDGFADLRFNADASAVAGATSSDEDAMRIAALLGVTEGPAMVLVLGAGAVNAATVAHMVPGLEVVAAWPALATEAESEGVSRVAVAEVLPLRSATMRGVALTDAGSEALLAEAARVVAPRGRVVVFNGSADIAERLEEAGLRVLARDVRATVAMRAAI